MEILEETNTIVSGVGHGYNDSRQHAWKTWPAKSSTIKGVNVSVIQTRVEIQKKVGERLEWDPTQKDVSCRRPLT